MLYDGEYQHHLAVLYYLLQTTQTIDEARAQQMAQQLMAYRPEEPLS